MELVPSPHVAVTMLFIVAVFVGFATGRVKAEIVALVAIACIALGLYAFPLAGTERKDGLNLAFSGFGHPALIAICSLMIMGRGLVVTGALDPAARALARVWAVNQWLGLLVTLAVALLLSMVVNDTPVLVLLIPVMVQLANGGAMPTSKTLMPLNAAILIGGMATTIGTSTNLLVVSIASDLGMPSLTVFQFTPIVLMAALVALPYIWLVMPRLMPDNSRVGGVEIRKFAAVLRLHESSTAVGRSIDEVRDLVPDVDLSTSDAVLHHDSRIYAKGSRAELEKAERMLSAVPAPRWLMERLASRSSREREDLVEVEVALTRDSRLIGYTLQASGIEGVAIIGINRAPDPRGVALRHADDPLAEGDVLIAMGLPEDVQAFARRDGLLVLDGMRELPRTSKAVLALVIMGVAVLLASFGLLPISVSALGGAIAMLATGCVRFDRVGRALSAKVVVMVASSIAIGALVLESGAAAWMAKILALGLVYLPAWAVLASIMAFVTVLTNFASNATAAAVGTPIAFSLAQQLGLPVEPMVLAVLFGCNLCYATPIAYQTNILIMSEGDYEFRDYLRAGVPLVLIMISTLAFLLVRQYSL